MALKNKQTSGAPASEKKRRNQAPYGLYILLGIILIVIAVGSVFARYVYGSAGDGSVKARNFYFNSDKLDREIEEKEYTLNPGTKSVTFVLKNHEDDLRFSDDNITYTVTTDGGTLSVAEGTLDGDSKSSVTVTLSDLEDGNTYTVKAVGTAGYKETLVAEFVVMESDDTVYKHLDYLTDEAYVVLTVWTADIHGDAKIEFPAGLIPDGTDPILATVVNYIDGDYTDGEVIDNSSFTSPYTSRTYRFFKDNVGDSYNVEMFTVQIDGKTAVVGTPG